MTIRKMTVSDAANVEQCCVPKHMQKKAKLLIALVIVLTLFGSLLGFFIGRSESRRWHAEPPDPEVQPPPSPSFLHVFQSGAVCTDAPHCSQIGRDILVKNGSAVDAAIAAMFCNGLLNMQSMGLGGGFFMTVYIKAEKKAYTVNAREKAPEAATADMFHGNQHLASRGSLSVGVPGELRGMWAAWQRWGRLPWRSLVEPTLELCKHGFVISKPLFDGLELAPHIQNDAHLREQYYNHVKGQFRKPGTIVTPSKALCNTLTIIAERGGDELYNGSLARDFLDDLTTVGSIISQEDLRNYEKVLDQPSTPLTVVGGFGVNGVGKPIQFHVTFCAWCTYRPKISPPLEIPMGQGDVLYTPPPPSSGVILINILNILNNYNFTKEDIATTNDTTLTYHRILEAFKYAYATRTKLGDMDFLDLKELIDQVSSPEYGKKIRDSINDERTSNDTEAYGAKHYTGSDGGTAHISIIGTNGDAVSMTSSINYYFGAGFSTLKTGIIMNNVMDDFSSPGFKNYFGVEPSVANFIQPRKRPLSSMTPSIVVDKTGNAKLVIGASGGTKITTAVALVAMRQLWFKQNIKEAVDSPRFHHQVFPMNMEYEYGIPRAVIQGLREKGHGIVRYKGRGSIVCAMFRNSTAIYANSDFRKGGDVAGLD